MDCVPTASVVSLLIAVTKCVDEISEAIEELSSKARFEKKSMSSTIPSRSHRPRILHRGTMNPTVEDEMDGGDFVTIEIGDNVESKGEVVVEEVNQVNNTINATKEDFVIWIRGSSAMAIVEEMTTPKKIEDFMDLVDIKLYNSIQFVESTEGVLTILDGANQVYNPLTAATEGESIVIGIRGNTTTTKVEEMEMTEKKVELTDLTDIKFNNSTQFLESILMTVTTIVEEMKTSEKKETL